MLKLLKILFQTDLLTSKTVESYCRNPEKLGNTKIDLQNIPKKDQKFLGRSLLVRHLDVGSNNAEEAELVALTNPYYDISRFGIDFVASPRHADALAITGPVTRNLKVAMELTYASIPKPCIVIAIGDGACYGTPYTNTYACLGPVNQFLPVNVYIPGDPPSPDEILRNLLQCKNMLLNN